MLEFLSHSPEETAAFAAEFSRSLSGGEIIAFTGGLGMGKTCFTAGLARGLGFTGQVTSPTFAVMNEYTGGRLSVYHFDMYRISSWEDLESCGYYDYIDNGGVTVIEWSENILAALDDNTISITIEAVSESRRRITVKRGVQE